MSKKKKQQTTEKTKQPNVNNQLTDRLNSAYIAKKFTLLNGGTDNIIMVSGERDGKDPIDILMIYSNLKEVLENLAPDTVKPEEDKTDVHEE